MKDKSAFQQKIKLLTKLFDFGCNTEKKLQQLDMESILKIPGITIPDMALILEFQKETKANKILKPRTVKGSAVVSQQATMMRLLSVIASSRRYRCRLSDRGRYWNSRLRN